MADEADIASGNLEYDIAESIRTCRKPSGPIANGRCHSCDEIVSDTARFCNVHCRDEWDRQQIRNYRGRK